MMEYIYPCFIAFAASFVFCIILNVKDTKIAFVASIGAALGWFMYLVAGNFVGVAGKNLIAAITAALFAEIVARKMKTPATVFIIVGILPMVPGGGIYYTMEYCIAFQRKKVLSYTTICMNLEDPMLIEISQTEKNKYCTLSLIRGI